jgi:hypothetical protein
MFNYILTIAEAQEKCYDLGVENIFSNKFTGEDINDQSQNR